MTVRIDALNSSTLVPQQPIEWQKLDINTLQFNSTGAFTLLLPATDRNWQLVTFDSQGEFQPVVLYVDWNGVFQVPLLAEQWEHDLTVDPNTGIITETITLSGADLLALLANRVVFVDGTQTWANQPVTPRTVTGPAETVIKTLVTENTVTCGDSVRVVPNFTVATDQGRGGTVSYTIVPPLPSTSVNFLTGDSTNFEAGTGTWVGGANASIAKTSARSHGGSSSLKVTSAAAGTMSALSCSAANITSQGLPVRPGDSISVSAWLRADAATETIAVGADFYDISGTYLLTRYGAGQSDQNTGWTQITGSVAAPDSAVFARASIQIANTNAGGEIHYVDDVSIADTGSGYTSGHYVANLGSQLMDMIRNVAAQSQIGVQITLSGTNLVFDCYIPQDLSAKAVFSTALGNLRGDSISDATPTADVVLMENGAEPPGFSMTNASGDAATDPWRRAEKFDDQTSTTDPQTILNAVTSDLADGASVHQLTITATDIPMLRFGKTVGAVQGYQLGDTVTVSIRTGVAYTDIVSAVELTAGSDTSGTVFAGPTTGVQVAGGFGTYYEVVTPTIGTGANSDTTDRSAISRLTAQVRRIDKAVAKARKAGQ